MDAPWVKFWVSNIHIKFLSQYGLFSFFSPPPVPIMCQRTVLNKSNSSSFNLPPHPFYSNHSMLIIPVLSLSWLLHCLVADVTALRFVGPSTWVYFLTSNNFWPNFVFLLFLIFCLQQFLCTRPPSDIIPTVSNGCKVNGFRLCYILELSLRLMLSTLVWYPIHTR